MLVLGLNAYHGDASAALIRDGIIVAAVEEERFRRIKHWAGFPSESVRYCLAEAGCRLSDIDHVAINSNPKASFVKKVSYALFRRPDFRLITDRLHNRARRQSIEAELETAIPGDTFNGKVHRIEHHLAHMASSFFVSPFSDATVLSIDGFGDFCSVGWGQGHGNTISVEDRVYFPHSLGVFYQALTQFLGFPHYGDEYKVMGLAPYGKPNYLREMRQIVKLLDDGKFVLDLTYFRHHTEKIPYEWSGGTPHVGTLFSPVIHELLGPARATDEPLTGRHRDIARSIQTMYEEAFFHLLNVLSNRHRLPSITLAGGCAMNSVANGKIMRETPYKRVYIQAAAGDAGGAIGAAIYLATVLGSKRAAPSRVSSLSGDDTGSRAVMDHAYLGPAYSDDEIGELLNSRKAEIVAEGCSVELLTHDLTLCERTACAVAKGEVVGWYQGRLEWGPRALGNRSIVCDPRRADMKDILNRKIKRRESFRPFAPSIQREQTLEWFQEDADVPFMMQVFQIREDKRAYIPAVCHVDGTGRLQTVYKSTNPRYWSLIEAFRLKTGVPMVLNTSFNENEPVVCKPAEALDCFLRTRMDVLVLGSWFISRNERAA